MTFDSPADVAAAVLGAAGVLAVGAGLARGAAFGGAVGAAAALLFGWIDLAAQGFEAVVLDLPLLLVPPALGVAIGDGRDRVARRLAYRGDRAAEAEVETLRAEAEAARRRTEGLGRSEAAMARLADEIRGLAGRETRVEAAAAVEAVAVRLLGRGRAAVIAEAALDGGGADAETCRRALARRRPVFGEEHPPRAAVPIDAAAAGRYVLLASTAEGERPLDDGDLRLLFAVGAAAALSLASADLAERTARAARVDALTGLLLRAPFLEVFEEEVTRARRSGRDLAVAILDLDRFKSVNDTFGHEAGDRVLREAAGVLRAWLPPEATAGRYGGEEFAVALPGADLAAALARFEDLRARLEATARRPDGTPLTASIGVASLRGLGEAGDVEALLSLADRALYAAKGAGRNRVAEAPRP